ncbi:hypothetical protein [Terracidiphilus sp.]|jgi:hypothetical protein|uniref:hypothetical protein n=1 Tax=Terracidiphilus sp. TaxID=1964191 RepID=UPI003C1A5146
MAPAALVNLDIDDGQKVVQALDKAGNNPSVALWAKLPDYENWRLILASNHFDQVSQSSGYSEIIDAMDKAGIPIYRQPTVLLRSMQSSMIDTLRNTFSSAADTYGMRLGGQRFGDQYIEEAFVYRIH